MEPVIEKRLLHGKSPITFSVPVFQVTSYQLLEQLITIDLTDHAAGTVVIGDVGRIFGQKIANDLIDGIIAFFIQSVEYIPKNSAHFICIIGRNGKLNGVVVRQVIDLLCILKLL